MYFFVKCKKYFMYAALLSCFVNILQLTFSYYMFAIYDVVLRSFSIYSLYSSSIIAAFCMCALFAFNLFRGKLLSLVGVELSQLYSCDVFEYITCGYAGPLRRTYSQGIADLESLRAFLDSDALRAIFDIPWSPFYLIIIFFFHPVLGWVTLSIGVFVLFLTYLQDRLTRAKLLEANGLAQENKKFIDTMLLNAEVINSMGMVASVFEKFSCRNDRILYLQTLASRFAGSTQSALKSVQVLLNILIYGVGAYLAIEGDFNAGLIIIVSVIEGQALSPFMRILFGMKQIVQAREAYWRFRSFLEFHEQAEPRMSLPVPCAELAAESIVFGYGGRLLLSNISFLLPAGQFLGLIGPNGAGKTTLMRVLLGIWPAPFGVVRFGGVAMNQWNRDDLGRYIGYLPQEIELFPMTIAENIARAGDVDMQEVARVSALVGVSDMIESLPEGYATLVGEGGVQFSGGQKQRLGLARSLYGAPKILFLDEPNSNLDEEGEEMLVRALLTLKERHGVSCIVITHKMSLLRMVDKVLMLQSGQVAHYGGRDEVLAAVTQSQMGH